MCLDIFTFLKIYNILIISATVLDATNVLKLFLVN